MRFKEYLEEAKHRTDISVEKAIELLKEHCKDGLKNIETPCWRGSKGAYEEAYIIHAEKGNRESKNTTNYYTLIMDHFLPAEGYPLRSKAMIFGNYPQHNYVSSFGNVYAVFPFDGVKIGMCEDFDLWKTKISIGNNAEAIDITYWNDIFEHARVDASSYQDMKNSLISIINASDPTGSGNKDFAISKIKEIFGKPQNIEMMLKKAYSPEDMGLKLVTSKNIPKGERHELWVSGKCVALSQATWEKVVKQLKEENAI